MGLRRERRPGERLVPVGNNSRSVEHTAGMSPRTVVFPVINAIVPQRGSVERLAATVFVLEVKGDILSK